MTPVMGRPTRRRAGRGVSLGEKCAACITPAPSSFFPILCLRASMAFLPWTLSSCGCNTSSLPPPQNFLPVGEQLRAALGNAALHKRVPDLQPRAAPGASDKASCTPFPFRTGLASAHVTEEPAASPRVEPAGPQHPALLEDGPTKAASSLPAKTASVHANGPGPDLLPFLQDLCSQVSHLRAGPKARWQEPLPRAQDVPAGLP